MQSGEKGIKRYIPEILVVIFISVFVWLGISPADRAVWYVENTAVVIVFILLVSTARYFRFSSTAYVLMFIWLFLHTIGAHYTFEKVPFGFVTDLFGFERNHYDRVAHFCIGFYAYPIAEFLTRKGLKPRWFICIFSLFAIMSMAAAWEIIEWIYADIDGGDVGAAFLGSQGDIWDAQKDMLADTLGALTAIVLFYIRGTCEKTYGESLSIKKARVG